MDTHLSTHSGYVHYSFGLISIYFGSSNYVMLMIQYILKEKIKLEPYQAQYYQTALMIPFLLKLLVGILIDRLGSKPIQYLIFTLLQLFCFVLLIIVDIADMWSPELAFGPLFMYFMNFILLEILFEGMVIVLSRWDNVGGAEEVVSYMWVGRSYGRLIGSLFNAFAA